jgi:hypothetical protein
VVESGWLTGWWGEIWFAPIHSPRQNIGTDSMVYLFGLIGVSSLSKSGVLSLVFFLFFPFA